MSLIVHYITAINSYTDLINQLDVFEIQKILLSFYGHLRQNKLTQTIGTINMDQEPHCIYVNRYICSMHTTKEDLNSQGEDFAAYIFQYSW